MPGSSVPRAAGRPDAPSADGRSGPPPGAVDWTAFAGVAPRIAALFERRHRDCGHLCLLATTRADGSPRISPMEPRFVDGELVLIGMPRTQKFADLARDPRFCLHTASADPQIPDGDAKLFGVAVPADASVAHRVRAVLGAEAGVEFTEDNTSAVWLARLTGAGAVEVRGDHLDLTVWRIGHAESTTERYD